MVKAVVTGTGELKSISIAPEVVDPDDVEMLEDLVVAAVTEGLAHGPGARVAEDGRPHRRHRPRRAGRAGGLGGLLG